MDQFIFIFGTYYIIPYLDGVNQLFKTQLKKIEL